MNRKVLLTGLFLSTAMFGFSQWEPAANYSGGAAYSTASFVIGDKAYVGGGNPSLNSFFEYDIASDIWTPKATIAGGFNRASPIAFAINGKGYIGGGAEFGSGVTNTFYEYDPTNDAWTQKADFPGGNKHSGFYRAANGKGYVFAGSNGGSLVADVWEYDPVADSWTQKSNHPEGAVYWPSGFVIDDKIYIGTGTANSMGLTSFYEYDPANDTWTQKADFPGDVRIGAVGFSIDQTGFIGGGGAADFSGSTPDFYSYDVETDTWTQETNLSYPNGDCIWSTAFSHENDAYMGTGANLNGGVNPTSQFHKALDLVEILDPNDPANWPNGIDEEDAADIWYVYPNPAHTEVFVDYASKEVNSETLEVLDMLGRTVHSEIITSQRVKIDVENFEDGVYFIRISNNTKTLFTEKLVIRK